MPFFDQIDEVLNENNVGYNIAVDNSNVKLYKMTLNCDNGSIPAYITVFKENRIVHFTAGFPLNIKEDQLSKVAEFVTRLNIYKVHGYYLLDYEDGSLCFRTSHVIDRTFPTSSLLIFNLLTTVCWTVDGILSTVLKLISTDISPQEAVDAAINSD